MAELTFDQMVLESRGAAYGLACRILRDPEAAADAVQESLAKAYRARASRRGGSFHSWLLTTTRNTCFDLLRYRRRHASESFEKLDDEGGLEDETAPTQHLSPEENVLQNELGAAINACLQQLPEEQRRVIVLADMYGYSHQEIARLTRVEVGTVKSRLSRGRAAMRDRLLAQPDLLPASYRYHPARGESADRMV